MKAAYLYSAVAAALVATALPVFAQMPAPTMVNVTRYQVKLDHLQEFEEVEKQIAGSFKKAAPNDQFRIVYRDVMGSPQEFWVLTPLPNFAARDGENPYNKLTTEQERLTRTARLSQYIERVQNSIDKTMPELSAIGPDAKFPPTFVRHIRIRVRQGSADDFANTIKTYIVPALKTMNGATLRVRRTMWGGNTADFTVAAGFEKWAALDDTGALPKAVGEENFKKFQEKMAQIEAGAENYILRYQPDLSYYPGAPSSTARR